MAESMGKTGSMGSLGRAGEPARVPVRSEMAGRRREDRIVGASQATRDLVDGALAAARTDLTVLLVGVEGSDRELVARAIHSWGPRVDNRFETLSCGAIPEALQAREVFGCEAGVYPAAPEQYAGALDRCHGGTLFLDLDGAAPKTRTRIFEALSQGSFRTEGGGPKSLATRVVGALQPGSDRSGFSAIAHHEIRIRPLSERPEDILPLAAHYLAAFSEESGFSAVGFTSEARACLLAEDWTGDVLELRQRIRQAVRLSGQGAITAEALLLARDSEEVPSFKEAKRAFETRYVETLLRRCGGNISRAARLARKDRKDFYDVIRRTGVNPSEFR